ncbi:MAG: AbrB/MazE/SpoVT family DNA-binding domain-containing protein [Candidatus Lambdaproteobacteria bacterium]|nr:AbrB/MazE/SpoVT family DNA-binding domain-containing protein [Candidatus Lambdaproteobacteria bacterium]
MDTKVAKWGNSMGLRLPKQIVTQAALHPGDEVTIEVREGRIVVTKKRRPYTLDELVRQMRPDQQHEEIDWGHSVGEEFS